MEIPTTLAYERSVHPSDVCFLVVWPSGEKEPLGYSTRKILGQMESAALAYDKNGEIKSDATPYALAQGNPHQLDFCHLPYGAEHIECQFSVSFSSELRRPFKCNDANVKSALIELIQLYESKIGWNELVTRFLTNICQGAWLWKNTKRAYQIDIEVKPWPWNDELVCFSDIRNNYYESELLEGHSHWKSLKWLIEQAFSRPNGLCIFEVKAKLVLPTNGVIYPSQTFTEKETQNKNAQPSRVFQHTLIQGTRSPIIGCYKVGAAIFTIDDWYHGAEEKIRIGKFGAHKEDVTCYRHPESEQDFYSYLKMVDAYIELLKGNDELSQEQVNNLHFLVANIIKGGLFQHKGS